VAVPLFLVLCAVHLLSDLPLLLLPPRDSSNAPVDAVERNLLRGRKTMIKPKVIPKVLEQVLDHDGNGVQLAMYVQGAGAISHCVCVCVFSCAGCSTVMARCWRSRDRRRRRPRCLRLLRPTSGSRTRRAARPCLTAILSTFSYKTRYGRARAHTHTHHHLRTILIILKSTERESSGGKGCKIARLPPCLQHARVWHAKGQGTFVLDFYFKTKATLSLFFE